MNLLFWYQHLPLHISPIAFAVNSFSIRWYAISYIVSFLVIYGVLFWRINSETEKVYQIFNVQFSNPNKIKNPKSEIQNFAIDFLLVTFFAALLGGRIGYVLFYNLSYYVSNPLAIISPYDQATGSFVGLYGMSYHGALVAILIASAIFLKKRKVDFFAWADFIIPAVAAGYFFGRIGNFLNGELYGRVTTSPWGMYFASNPQNLRYPSQLLEAFFEGILLFVILWLIRNKNLARGSLLAIYFIGYGVFRILVEQFREPDSQIGFIVANITLGQVLSISMVLAGFAILVSKRCKK